MRVGDEEGWFACVRERRLRVAFDMRAQFGDRAELDRSVRQLGLDRSIRIKRIGHAVDDPGLENGGRPRLPEIGSLLLAIFAGILCLAFTPLDPFAQSPLPPLS